MTKGPARFAQSHMQLLLQYTLNPRVDVIPWKLDES
jgi:hypothetical protein